MFALLFCEIMIQASIFLGIKHLFIFQMKKIFSGCIAMIILFEAGNVQLYPFIIMTTLAYDFPHVSEFFSRCCFHLLGGLKSSAYTSLNGNMT